LGVIISRIAVRSSFVTRGLALQLATRCGAAFNRVDDMPSLQLDRLCISILDMQTMFSSSDSHSTPLCAVGGVSLSTLASPISPLWPPDASAAFASPQTFDEAAEVKKWLYGLQDGQIFACRGRDYALNPILAALQHEDPDALCISTSLPPQLTEWEYGVGIKMDRAVFLLWESKVEKHDIGSLDLVSLLHICGHSGSHPPRCDASNPVAAALPQNLVIILCHGFSPEIGASYPLLIILNNFLSRLGCTVCLPDFRDTYAYGAARGRSERVCVVLESLLHLRSLHPDSRVVLIGHSQGGAAVAQACRRSVVADGCIRGLVMIGSESARERIRPPELFPDEAAGSDASTSSAEIYGQRPFGLAPPQILMLHSARDPVISRLAIQQLVREPTKSIFEKWRWCFKSYTPSGA